MDEYDELLAVTAQRDALARFIFEEGREALDRDYCLAEMAAERCPYRNLPYGEFAEAAVCAPCIIELIGKGVSVPPALTLSVDTKKPPLDGVK